MRRMREGIRRMSSGVRPTVLGSSAGSPSGSVPSGSRRAARCPCVRCALTSEVAAWTACSSCSSGGPAASGAGAVAAAVAAGGGGWGRRPELHAEAGEDRLVEAVLALELLLDDLQEPPGL